MYNTGQKKIQKLEVPQRRTIRRYDNLYYGNAAIAPMPKEVHKINTRKMGNGNRPIQKKNIKVSGVDKGILMRAAILISILLGVMLTQLFLEYNVTDLMKKRDEMNRALKELKLEVTKLENTTNLGYDLKEIEIKSKNLGFVNNENIKYIKLDNKK